MLWSVGDLVLNCPGIELLSILDVFRHLLFEVSVGILAVRCPAFFFRGAAARRHFCCEVSGICAMRCPAFLFGGVRRLSSFEVSGIFAVRCPAFLC